MLKDQIKEFINNNAIIVDVRTREEFTQAANPHSQNIPLNELTGWLVKLDRNRPIIVCCASGGRSAKAAVMLIQNGFKKVLDAGPWRNTVL